MNYLVYWFIGPTSNWGTPPCTLTTKVRTSSKVRIWHGWLKAWLQTSGQKKAKRPEISHLALWKIKHIQAGLGICHFIYKPRIVYQNRCQRCLIDSQRSNLQNHILSASISEWRKKCFWPSVLLFLASNRGTFQRDHRKGHDRHGHQKLHWRDTDETPHSCGKCCRFWLWGGRSMDLWPTKTTAFCARLIRNQNGGFFRPKVVVLGGKWAVDTHPTHLKNQAQGIHQVSPVGWFPGIRDEISDKYIFTYPSIPGIFKYHWCNMIQL